MVRMPARLSVDPPRLWHASVVSRQKLAGSIQPFTV